jgi:hypothetical protein
MNEMFKLGAADIIEKLAKSKLHPGAIAGLMAEGKTISKRLASKFKISPGEINKAGKTARKMSRKAAVKKEVTKRTTQKSFFKKPIPGEGSATKVTQHSAVKPKQNSLLDAL